MRIERKIAVVSVIIVSVMASVAAIPYVLHEQVDAALGALSATAARERGYEALLDTLAAATNGQQGYLISGKREFLDPYVHALAAIAPIRATLRSEPASADERARFARIDRETDSVLAGLAAEIAGGKPDAGSAGGPVAVRMEGLRRLVAGEISRDNEQRTLLRSRLSRASAFGADATLAATALNVLILLLALIGARRALRERAVARGRARRAVWDLRKVVHAAQRHSRYLADSSALMHALQLADSVAETPTIIEIRLRAMFPSLAGAFYLYRNSRDVLERRAAWGGAHCDHVLEPLDCWSLRRGAYYHATGPSDMQCRHGPHGPASLCVPLVSHGEIIGSLSFAGEELGGSEGERLRSWIVQLGEQVALTLANIELRARLRTQSFVDPLTQLYNRRYLDETLRRELQRAERNGAPVSLVLIDLDHFKRVNDSYGHETGDALLALVGKTLSEAVRGSDAACRYGGEEMLVLIPDCGHADAVQRAEDLRTRIGAICLPSALHGSLSPTASLGVATYPQHGANAAQLLAAADAALYRAKRQGRNCVCAADSVHEACIAART